MNRPVVAGAVAAVAFGASVRADITITSVTRFTDTQFQHSGVFPRTAPPQHGENSSTGDWSSDISTVLYGPPSPPAFVQSAQSSSVSATSLTGQFTVQYSGFTPSQTEENSRGLSWCTVSLSVVTPTQVHFSAYLDTDGIVNVGGTTPAPELGLVGVGHLFRVVTPLAYDEPVSASFDGVLQPGDYQVYGRIGYQHSGYRVGGPPPITGTMTAAFEFIVPAPTGTIILAALALGAARRRRPYV